MVWPVALSVKEKLAPLGDEPFCVLAVIKFPYLRYGQPAFALDFMVRRITCPRPAMIGLKARFINYPEAG